MIVSTEIDAMQLYVPDDIDIMQLGGRQLPLEKHDCSAGSSIAESAYAYPLFHVL